MATSKTWTRTLKNLDPEKPGPSNTWILKNMEWCFMFLCFMFYEVMFYKHHAQCDLLFKSSCTKDVQTKFFDRL